MRYRAYKKVSRQRRCQQYPHQKQYVPLPLLGDINHCMHFNLFFHEYKYTSTTEGSLIRASLRENVPNV